MEIVLTVKIYISNGEGGVIIENNTFRRFCKCGFDITLDGARNEMEVDSCKKCKYFLYLEDNHEEYYCNYSDDYIVNLKICKYYSK